MLKCNSGVVFKKKTEKTPQKTILVANSLNPRYSVSILLLKNIEMAT